MNQDYQHLVGLDWKHPERDCYSLVRRFYQDCLDIELPDYARPAMWYATNPELDLIRNNFQQSDFRVIDWHDKRALRFGDVMAINSGGQVLCHLAVYVGNGKILHQMFRGPSQVSIYAGHWFNQTMIAARHKEVRHDLTLSTVDLMSLLPEHRRLNFGAGGTDPQ